MRMSLLFCSVLLLGLWNCSSDDSKESKTPQNETGDEEEDPDDFAEGPNLTGEDVFTKRLRGGNTFTCATCHSIGTDSDSWRRVGHSLDTASLRTSFKNGQLSTLQDAVNNCVEHWMIADPLTADDERWTKLDSWLAEQSTGTAAEANNITYTIATPPSDLSGGDVTEGTVFFNKSCASCHGEDAVGTDKGPALSGTTLTPEQMATRIRTSGLVGDRIF